MENDENKNINDDAQSSRHHQPRRQRGQSLATFSRRPNNFSTGILPNHKNDSTPVNTLSTGHSSKPFMKSFLVDTSGRLRHHKLPNSNYSESENTLAETTVTEFDNFISDVVENYNIPQTSESSSALPPQFQNDGSGNSPPQESQIQKTWRDNFYCPVKRTYLNEAPFHHHNKVTVEYSPRRFSLPSTHILYEKNRYRGCANILEQEKMAEMLKAQADRHDRRMMPITEAKNAELNLDISIIGPASEDLFIYSSKNIEHMKKFLEEKILSSNIDQITWSRVGALPRASYEEQAFVFEGCIKFVIIDGVKNEWILFTRFVEAFSKKLQTMLQNQVHFEVSRIPIVSPNIRPHHPNIPLTSISIGNCVNAGLFFIRGDYVTNENAVCGLRVNMQNTDPTRESHDFKVAGSNQLLSYARFEHDKRHLYVFFGVPLHEIEADGLEYCGFRLNLYYNSFVKVVVDMSSSNYNALYFQLKHPPQLWEALPKVSFHHPSKSRILNLETCNDWIRVLSWPGDGRSSGCSTEALAQSNWIRIQFPKLSCLEANEPNFEFVDVVGRLSARCSAKMYFGPIYAIRRVLTPTPPIVSLGSFRANYAMQALITRGSVVNDQIFDATTGSEPYELEDEPLFLKAVRRSMKECRRACEETLEQLLNAIDEKRSIDILQAFWSLYNARKDQYERYLSGERIQDIGLAKPLPKNCVAVPKVMVCPTRVLLMAPEVMMINRVVRKFGPDYALRCVFRDDNGGRLVLRDFSIGNIGHASNIVSEFIHSTLKHGIPIADRVYSFLGWSNSQMRDQGCYLYAPKTDEITGEVTGTVEEIRKWMGDFREAMSVPKMMSRMGQCFTQAQPTVRLLPKHWVVEEDIEGGPNKKYCFSDGCGRISVKLAAKITRMLDLKLTPACFQVRFKGFKGIVVIDPMIDEIVGMPKIIFRKSQRKFLDSSGGQTPDYLEVVKYAMPSPVCLNRPFITILDQVSEKQSKVSHERICSRVHYFLERELSILSNMLINEKCAAEELTNRTTLPIDWIEAANSGGFQLTTDPFVRDMIVSVYRYNIIHHISKAKIFLPSGYGRSMYGVVDETGLLQHGQVFIQYSPSIRQTSANPIVLKGKVLITKNPCHVPGDVRVFEAVYQPSLKHLVDVVVFPQHGPRPHPDEMAGSDLDGDEYSVIWDPEMFFEQNEKAMIFPSSQAIEDDKEPSTNDMVEFFLKYLQQDSIGRMSNAHLAFADLNGLFHEHCHSIALKCSVAVDFPKSGVPAEPLANYEQCDLAPDYMMSGTKPMYYSTRLNGQLYRKARKVEEILEEYERIGSTFEWDYDKVICPDGVDVFFGNEQLYFKTIAIRNEYARRIQQLLDEYGIENEASIVSGHAAIIKRLAGMEKDDYSFYHTDKVVELRYEKLFATFRQKFFEDFGGEEDHIVHENRKTYMRCTPAMHEKIRQWYYVSYVEPRKTNQGSKIGQSLPWVVWEALCDLKRQLMINNDVAPKKMKYPISERFGEEMRQSIEVKSDLYAEFYERVKTEKAAYCIQRYSEAYSNDLVRILFIIEQWLKAENVLPSDTLNIWHVGRILIQFGLGRLQGNGGADYERMTLTMESIFVTMLPRTKTEDEGVEIKDGLDIGTVMIEFLRYLSSQALASAKTMNLKVFCETNLIEPRLLRKAQWMPLHHIAYRTFHSIAISGRFDALYLTEEDTNNLVSEGKDPILVNESIFSSKSYSDEPISRPRVLAALKEWSGVKEILTRDNYGRKSDLVYVTSIGTVLARQRLARLLLLNGDVIREAIINERVPFEVRDDFV